MDLSNYSLTAKAQLLQQTNPTTVSTHHWRHHSFALFYSSYKWSSTQPEKDRWLETMPYIASKSIWRWSIEEIQIPSSTPIIIYSKRSINSTALSMLDHKANDHSYSQRALFVLFTLPTFDILFTLPIFEIRLYTSLPEYTVRDWKRQLFRCAFIIIASTRSINLKFYHLSCVFHIQLPVPLFIDGVIVWSTDESGKRALIFDRKYTHLHLYPYLSTLSLLRMNITSGKVHHIQSEFKD